jgi:hypothetical protein
VIGPNEAEEHANGCGLAGAIGTEESIDRPPGDFEIQPLHRDEVSEAPSQVRGFDVKVIR